MVFTSRRPPLPHRRDYNIPTVPGSEPSGGISGLISESVLGLDLVGDSLQIVEIKGNHAVATCVQEKPRANDLLRDQALNVGDPDRSLGLGKNAEPPRKVTLG